MLLEEIQQGVTTPEVLKYVLTGVGLLLSNALTYWLSRNKNKSEVDKNYADTHKSEAESTKVRVETIAVLLDEVDEMILTTKRLRSEIDIRAGERLEALSLIKKTLADTGDLIDLTVTTGSVQLVRMKTVGVAENLHKLRDLLQFKAV